MDRFDFELLNLLICIIEATSETRRFKKDKHAADRDACLILLLVDKPCEHKLHVQILYWLYLALQEASASISGEGAYGHLKFESGVHRVQVLLSHHQRLHPWPTSNEQL